MHYNFILSPLAISAKEAMGTKRIKVNEERNSKIFLRIKMKNIQIIETKKLFKPV